MNILKNKHLILAMFVAPILAIIAYFATDYVVSEKPHQAQQGNTYKLAAKSNCRYQSGQCTLQNGDVEVNITVERIAESMIELTLRSSLPAQKVMASFVDDNNAEQPVMMLSDTAANTLWHAQFNIADPQQATLRLVVELSGALFFAETPAVFIDYATTFSRDNFAD
jgi:hypothetical protein